MTLVVSPDHRLFIVPNAKNRLAARPLETAGSRHGSVVNGDYSARARRRLSSIIPACCYDSHQIIYAEEDRSGIMLIDSRTKGVLPQELSDAMAMSSLVFRPAPCGADGPNAAWTVPDELTAAAAPHAANQPKNSSAVPILHFATW